MGVRLYPQTKDAATLEKLAGVPAGTMHLLDLWKEMQKVYCEAKGVTPFSSSLEDQAHGRDIGIDFFSISHGSDVDWLETFLLNGWGKFSYKIPGQEECGELGPCREAVLMLKSSSAASFYGIDTDNALDVLDVIVEAGGVYWG
jgi:hypothetical protein